MNGWLNYHIVSVLVVLTLCLTSHFLLFSTRTTFPLTCPLYSSTWCSLKWSPIRNNLSLWCYLVLVWWRSARGECGAPWCGTQAGAGRSILTLHFVSVDVSLVFLCAAITSAYALFCHLKSLRLLCPFISHWNGLYLLAVRTRRLPFRYSLWYVLISMSSFWIEKNISNLPCPREWQCSAEHIFSCHKKRLVSQRIYDILGNWGCLIWQEYSNYSILAGIVHNTGQWWSSSCHKRHNSFTQLSFQAAQEYVAQKVH